MSGYGLQMNAWRSHSLLSIVAAFLLMSFFIGCSRNTPSSAIKPRSIDRLEIYYRSFSQLNPVSYSEEDLAMVAPVRLNVTDPELVDGIVKAISLSCEEVAGVSEGKMDVYLLIRKFRGERAAGYWKASPFHFYASANGSQVCRLDRTHRDSIEKIIGVAEDRPESHSFPTQ